MKLAGILNVEEDVAPIEMQSPFDVVGWLQSVVDSSAPTPEQQEKLQEIFLGVLRYEYQFFDMAYRGEKWPE